MIRCTYVGLCIHTNINTYVTPYYGKSGPIANIWPTTTSLTSKFINIKLPNDSDRFDDSMMDIKRYVHRYIPESGS